MRKSIIIIGDALMDNQYYIDEMPSAGQDIKVNEFAKSTGGSAANTAAKLASFDLAVSLVSAVGSDEDGQAMIKALQSKGVDTSFLVGTGQTGFTVTLIDSDGERTMLSHRGASANVPELAEQLKQKIRSADLLFISGYWMQTNEQARFVTAAAQEAKLGSAKVAFDPCPIVGNIDEDALGELLKMVDILLPNEAEYNFLKQNQALENIPCIAIKLGSCGAKMLCDGQEYEQLADTVQAVDTTGAGDAFNAGFLAAVLKGKEPQQWLKEGNECAAQAVGRRGAV